MYKGCITWFLRKEIHKYNSINKHIENEFGCQTNIGQYILLLLYNLARAAALQVGLNFLT